MSLQDRLTNVDAAEVAASAYHLVDALQFLPKDQQVAALSCVLLLVGEELGVDPRTELERSSRITRDADRRLRVEFAATRDYIRGELM